MIKRWKPFRAIENIVFNSKGKIMLQNSFSRLGITQNYCKSHGQPSAVLVLLGQRLSLRSVYKMSARNVCQISNLEL